MGSNAAWDIDAGRECCVLLGRGLCVVLDAGDECCVLLGRGLCVVLDAGDECCVLLGRGLCVVLITRPEESYKVLCLQWVWSRSPVRGGHDPASVRRATGKITSVMFSCEGSGIVFFFSLRH